jgi:hypothetical protein
VNTLNIGSNTLTGPVDIRRTNLQKVLLACGIVSSFLYIVATVLGALRWEGYSSTAQTVSELIAIDAPSAPVVIPMFVIYSLLIYAFGAGVWMSAGQKQALRVAAGLIVAKEVLGMFVLFFAPIHLRGVEGNLSDTMHGVFTGVGVLLCMFPAMGFAASALGKRFRLYSIGTMLVFLVCGVLAGLDQPNLVANLPTPWMGVWERINIFGYMLWIVVLAFLLIRAQTGDLSVKERG